jgi:hypothetical protein
MYGSCNYSFHSLSEWYFVEILMLALVELLGLVNAAVINKVWIPHAMQGGNC